MTIAADGIGDFEMDLNTPDGYIPAGIVGITTGQINWSIIQFRANENLDTVSASFKSLDPKSRTSNVRIYVMFIRTS